MYRVTVRLFNILVLCVFELRFNRTLVLPCLNLNQKLHVVNFWLDLNYMAPKVR